MTTGTVERIECDRDLVFEWKIKDFSKMDSRCCSDLFLFSDSTWYLRLFPDGETTFRMEDHLEMHVESEGYVILHLCSDYLRRPLLVRFSLGIRTAIGETIKEVTYTHAFRGLSTASCGSYRMMRRSDLLRRRDELLPLDEFTVRLTVMEKIPVEGARSVLVQTEIQGIVAEDAKDEEGEKTGTQKVLQDIGKMWPSDEHCDVVFKVGDLEFKAHKAILAARTPELAALFCQDTLEKSSRVVNIEDCHPAVFEQLLHYVYKGAPRELTPENACALYVAAQKYQMSEVTTLCLRCMRHNLCVDTFCNTIAFSLMHKEDELLNTAVDFFLNNMTRVVETVYWQEFRRDHSDWANEILHFAMKILDGNEEESSSDSDSSSS